MDIDPLTQLCAANVAFVGSHFALSHPLRAPLVAWLGERGFQAFYSLVSFAALFWVYRAYKASPTGDLGGSGEWGWILATVLTLPAMVLLAGSFVGNPALPAPGAIDAARAEPQGVFRVTRHPLMWAIAIWALAHIVLWSSLRSVISALAMAVLALVGAHLQDRKKANQLGEAWTQWQSRTSFIPRLGQIASVGLLYWVIGLMLWIALSWAHLPIGGIAAGIWRWF